MTYAPVENFLHVMKDERPRRLNPLTGEVRTTEWDYERDGPDPLEGFGTIGPYRPEIDKSEILPLVNIVSDLFNTARGDVNKRDYDKLQEQYNKEYLNSPQINPKGTDPFAPPPIRLAMGVPYTLPDQQIFYETGGKVHQMSKPIKDDYDLKRLMDTMNRRYGIRATNPMLSSDYQIAQEYPDNVWDEDDAVLLEFLKGGGLGIQEDAINKLIERRGSA